MIQYQHRLCEPCRQLEVFINVPKAKKPRQEDNIDSPYGTMRFVMAPSEQPPNEQPTNINGIVAQHQQPPVGNSSIQGVFQVDDHRRDLATQWSRVITPHTPVVGWTDFYNGQPPPFKTAESSLQGAIEYDSHNEPQTPPSPIINQYPSVAASSNSSAPSAPQLAPSDTCSPNSNSGSTDPTDSVSYSFCGL